MIYIISVTICFSLAWYYDILGRTKNKQEFYTLLMVWFILVSALQYMVGADMSHYYDDYISFNHSLSIDFFKSEMEDRFQPGWVILTWCCKLLSDDFLLFKTIHAVFLNVAVFRFFKKESRHQFLCILFYAISSYLVLNFNVLRHSYAIAFGLFAISYLNENKIYKYFLCVFGGYMFHNSALILLILPLLKFLKYSKYTGTLIVIGIFVGFFLLLRLDVSSLIIDIAYNGTLGENATSMIDIYAGNERIGLQNESAKISFYVIAITTVVLYYIFKRKDLYTGGLGLAYVILMLLTSVMPILMRLRLYFEIPYYFLLADVIINFPNRIFKRLKVCIYIVAIGIFCYYRYTTYTVVNPLNGLKYIEQYYPYHSIFDPVKEKRN